MKTIASTLFSIVLSFGLLAFAEPVEVTVKLSPAGSFIIKGKTVEGVAIASNGSVSATNINIPVNSLTSGIKLRDQHMRERLEGDKHPMISLQSGDGSGNQGKGLIKIKGIEKPIEGTYQVSGDSVTAEFKLSLKDFAIEKIRYLGVGVKDEVMVKVQVPLKK